MRMSIMLIMAGVLLATAGCALRPQLIKHHKSVTSGTANVKLTILGGNAKPTTPENLLASGYTVTGFATQVPPSAASAPFISKLSDRGQAQLIERVGAAAKNSEELTSTLLKLGEKPVRTCNEGPVRLERRLVLSLAGRHDAPATRFDTMAYVLTLKEPDRVRFISWNRFETLHETVALGTTRMKQNQTAGWKDSDNEKTTAAATAAAPAKELLSTLDLTATQSRELEETVASARRFTPITGTLSGPGAALIQQGAVGLDLFGNLTADFTLELGPGTALAPATAQEWVYTASGLFVDGKAQSDVAGTAVARCARVYAHSVSPINATLAASGIVRQVSKGDDTVIEGDDAAVYATLPAATAADIELVDRASLARVYFSIKRTGKDYNLYNHADRADIKFPTLDEARNWVRWLRETGNTELKGTKLGWLGPPSSQGGMVLLRKDEAASLEVHRCESGIGPDMRCGVIWK
jgi:hypothetical protein